MCHSRLVPALLACLAEHGIPAPRFLFLPVEDRVEVDVEGIASRMVK